ncbi:MAG TPA: ATP-binding protein [Chryseolinea sp.]
MKRFLIFALYFLLYNFCEAQISGIDSLVREISVIQNDRDKLLRLRTITRLYAEMNPDSSYRYSVLAANLARQLNLKIDEGGALGEQGYSILNRGNYPSALKLLLSSIAVLEDRKAEQNVLVGKFEGDDRLFYREAPPHLQRLSEIAFVYQHLGVLYANANNYEKARQYHLHARRNATESGNVPMQSIVELTFNRVYLNLGQTDSALISINIAYDKMIKSGYTRYLGSALLNKGRTYAAMGNASAAVSYYKQSLRASAEKDYYRGLIAANLLLANYYMDQGKRDSALLSIEDAFRITARDMDSPELLLRTYTALNRYYSSSAKSDSVVKYQGLIIKLSDSLFNAKQAQEFQNIDFDAQLQRQEIANAEAEFKDRLQKYFLLGGLVVILLIAVLLYRNNKIKQRSNDVLQKTLGDLKSAQAQLIQSEKMASLGELTAGIAHEIQNPLNFVNNFSDVNKELLAEMTEEIERGNYSDAKALAKTVTDNQEKINHHGRRADSIVKNMLLHSRTSSGLKELTELNTLCEEYLRLAYHGFRAKDKSFNATYETRFDPTSPKLDVVPQEIGRVILNLVNNAFYAVNERKKQERDTYEPLVIVSTKKIDSKVEIKVTDNGGGITEAIIKKIFQPFFSTKPTGQGTGLGLSLSYDIVRAHGGDITVETKEGETTFIVQIPSNSSAA